jgi:hypothetical protein
VSGDGWSRIASKNSVTLSALLAANNATTATWLFPKQMVCLPAGATPPTTTLTPASATQPPTTPPVQPVGAVTLQAFPVQGTCGYIDTFGAPRSGGRSHEGVDILAKANQFIYAVSDGTLTKQYIAGTNTLTGNGWRLTRADGTYFFYAHLSAFAPGLTVGSTVVAGQIIGWNGMTGNAGSPHLHFEVHPGGGAAINPTPIVKAVDGCKSSAVPPQPGGVIPQLPTNGAPPATAPPATTPPATTPPATTPPASTPPATAPPATTPPVTTPPATTPSAAGSAGTWAFHGAALALDTQGTRLTARTPRTISVNALSGVASDTPAVMVRVSARNLAGEGYVTIHNCAVDGLTTSTLNVRSGRLNATTAIAAVTSGTICVTASVAMDVRIEVIAHQAAGGTRVAPITARRALDTRTAGTPIPAQGNRTVSLSALGLTNGSKAATVSVTLVRPANAGSIGIGPCGGTPWVVTYGAGTLQVLSGTVRINDAGLCMTTTTAAHVVVDVTAGWVSSGGAPIAAVGPTRVFDSRSSGAAITGAPTAVPLPLPAGATVGQVTLTLVSTGTPSSVFAWPCAAGQPSAAPAVVEAGAIANATVVVSGSQLCLSALGSAHVIVDLTAAG